MKILVLGEGFLGKEFKRNGFTDVWGRDKFSFTNERDFFSAWSEVEEEVSKYDVIINCIAKSNTRWCEQNLNEALFVNGYFPACLSNWCKKNDKQLVHISTGCLYDDTTIQNKETDFLAAHCNYTVTKWIGDKGCDYNRDIVLRPRLLFSDVPDANNLLCKLPNYKKFVNDKRDSLTSTFTIVKSTALLLKNKKTGVFNVANDGDATIYEIAGWCDNFGKKTVKPTRIATVRKHENLHLVNNVMDISKLKEVYEPTDIKKEINRCYSKLNID